MAVQMNLEGLVALYSSLDVVYQVIQNLCHISLLLILWEIGLVF
jgi:hypothetical protein